MNFCRGCDFKLAFCKSWRFLRRKLSAALSFEFRVGETETCGIERSSTSISAIEKPRIVMQAPKDRQGLREPGGFHMKYLRYVALLAVCIFGAGYSRPQNADDYGYGDYSYDDYSYDDYSYAPSPVCNYGYYAYPPYACAPYGYWGPDFFVDGVFIGAGPWFPGWYGRGYYSRSGYGGYGGGRGGYSGGGGEYGGRGNFAGGRSGYAAGHGGYAGGGHRGYGGGAGFGGGGGHGGHGHRGGHGHHGGGHGGHGHGGGRH